MFIILRILFSSFYNRYEIRKLIEGGQYEIKIRRKIDNELKQIGLYDNYFEQHYLLDNHYHEKVIALKQSHSHSLKKKVF